MTKSSTDQVRKQIALRAPRSRVWRALSVVESGFDQIPAERRELAFRMNGEGWTAQMENIARHVGG
jgi:hypothetical protein